MDGWPREIIGNCNSGFLINPLEPESISESLLKILSDRSLWRQCADNGFMGVREFYAWEAHAKRYLQLVLPFKKERNSWPEFLC